METVEVGRIGENIARKHLESCGYKIIEQNYKTRYLEIDLIAHFKKNLVFFEVRTKTGEDFGRPEETIDKTKIKKLIKNTQVYAAMCGYQGSCQIDAICIVLNPDFTLNRLNHYENITS